MAAVLLQQLWKIQLMDRRLATPESGQFLVIVIYANDRMTNFSKACCGNESYVSRSDYCNLHFW